MAQRRPPRARDGRRPAPRPTHGDRFILFDQGQDLLRAPGVVAVEAPQIPYGALGRMPDVLSEGLASTQARRLRPPGQPVGR